MKTARRKTPTPAAADPLNHFSRDGPITRLIAHFINKLPAILFASGPATLLTTAKLMGYW